jgi:hypothetical protein
MAFTFRTVRFSLSKALSDSQLWAIESFPEIIQRATGYSERWSLIERTKDEPSGTYTWQYQVQSLPDIDLIVDHIVHELTDAVLLSEWHSVNEDRFTFGNMKRDRPEGSEPRMPEQELLSKTDHPLDLPPRGGGQGKEGAGLILLLVTCLVFSIIPVYAQSQQKDAATPAPETALVAVAKHLSPPYALYLYESLTRQILSNQRLMERLDSPQSPMAADSLWALEIISQSLLVDGQDGQYLDVRRVPPFLVDAAQRYLNPSHYWPDQEITQDNRREHLAAWYSMYLMLLVANATQDEIAKTIRGGMFDRTPEQLEPGGPSLVDQLHQEKVLNDHAYSLVRIKRSGPPGHENLTLPAYLAQWKAKISQGYGVKSERPIPPG